MTRLQSILLAAAVLATTIVGAVWHFATRSHAATPILWDSACGEDPLAHCD